MRALFALITVGLLTIATPAYAENYGSLPPPHQGNSPWVAIITVVVVAGVLAFFLFLFREYVKNSSR